MPRALLLCSDSKFMALIADLVTFAHVHKTWSHYAAWYLQFVRSVLISVSDSHNKPLLLLEYRCRRTAVKTAMPRPSGIWHWLIQTGWAWLESAFWVSNFPLFVGDRKGIQPVKYLHALSPKCSFSEQKEEEKRWRTSWASGKQPKDCDGAVVTVI